jgi:Class III cytochrome C family/Cytochrome c7 and related cytochrome c
VYLINCKILLATLLVTTALTRAADDKKSSEPPSPRPVKQPVEFSHKRHAELGLECEVCHPMADGEQAGIPQTVDCMNCHQSSDSSKPAFQSLFEHAKANKPIAWKRVYLLPYFVFFGHGAHQKAKDGCTTCHGPVASRDMLWKERETSMKACMDCHKANRASVSCSFCHELNQ